MLEKAAFELLPGEISGILAWGDQYAILYKQGESKPLVQEFEAVQEELHKEILEKKRCLIQVAKGAYWLMTVRSSCKFLPDI